MMLLPRKHDLVETGECNTEAGTINERWKAPEGGWSSGETSSNENEYVTSEHEPEAVNSGGTGTSGGNGSTAH